MPLFERVSADLPVTLKTATYSVVAQDSGTEIQFQSASTLTANLPAVASVENGFNLVVRNVGAAALTIDPSGSETIDGASTAILATDDWRWIRNDGTGWRSVASNASTIPNGSITIAKLADEAKPYDFSFIAGFSAIMAAEDIAVQDYATLIVGRSLTIEGEVGYLETAATGSAAIVDIKKNGSTIYSVKPSFAVSSNTLTAGTLSSTSLSSGDRLTFGVTQIGSTISGQGIRFTLKTHLS
jgi:hypothetical protein